MSITVSTVTLPGAALEGVCPLPFFRNRAHDQPLVDGGLLPEELVGFRYETGFRILPYLSQDRYSRDVQPLQMDMITLENSHLRAEFLPGYGGRLWSLYDKDAGRELLFSNPVFQPANLAIRNAWFSGGIEWNLGQFGHTCLTCEPVFFASCTDADGTPFLRMYEYERQKRLFLHIDFHLPDDSRCLLAHVCVTNSSDEPVPLYWWTNIAVREEKNIRVCSGSDEVIYICPETLTSEDTAHAFAHGTMPFLPTLGGQDASYPQNIPYSSEYFFQNRPDLQDAWETVSYDDGSAFWERSTAELPYRKMFCWGNARGGAHWKDFLSLPGQGDYLEIQAGAARSQVHGFDLAGGGVWRFTQAFGGMTADPTHANACWKEAKTHLYECMDGVLSASRLLELDAAFTAAEGLTPNELLTKGSGWGALEAQRDPSIIPVGMLFPEDTLGAEQLPWKTLLEKGYLTESEDGLPSAWMTDPRWGELLRNAMEKPEKQSPAAYLHLGVLCYENGDWAGGIQALERAEQLFPTAITAFCLAQAAAQEGDLNRACALIRLACERGGSSQDHAFSEEFLTLHNRAGRFSESWAFFEALSDEQQKFERVRLIACAAAFHEAKWAFLDQQFTEVFAVTREGELGLIDLWFKRQAVLTAEKMGIPNDGRLLEQVRAELEPPYILDFRMSQPGQN